MAGFDWYQATIREPVDDVLEALSGLGERPSLRHARGVQGYGHTTAIEDGSGLLASVWHGGSHEYPHAVITGETAQAGAELIRARFPRHSVTRVDVREDFDGADTFDRLVPMLLGVAREHRVKVDTAGDHLLTMEGRTVYLGARSSNVRLRLYDKAAELRAKFSANPARLAQIPDHLTRFEAQVRPKVPIAKQGFASIKPVEVMGASEWLRVLWYRIMGTDVEPVQVGRAWRQSDDERALSFMLQHYGALLRRLEVVHGSWACVGQQLGQELEDRERAKRLNG